MKLAAPPDDWPSKRIVVTAGASGIGRAMVEAFHALGARQFVCDIAPERLAELRSALPLAGVHPCDVSVPEQVDAFIDDAARTMGGIDILINNAGIAGPAAPVEEISTDDWNRTFAVNVAGQFYCARRAVPYLKKAGGGVIINMSSVAGKFGFPLRSPYSASKWAVIGFTKSLSIELGPAKIRVNAILPSIVTGERNRQVFSARAKAKGISYEEMSRQAVERVSLRTMIDPEEVAELAVFLCSRHGRAMTGDAIEICGGTESIV
jgi:NAD(P)-dependent dehydrogenase (short-subunit alcohol dehydrogenase family)